MSWPQRTVAVLAVLLVAQWMLMAGLLWQPPPPPPCPANQPRPHRPGLSLSLASALWRPAAPPGPGPGVAQQLEQLLQGIEQRGVWPYLAQLPRHASLHAGVYRVHASAAHPHPGPGGQSQPLLTLCSQTSTWTLPLVAQQALAFDGPLSVAVFVDEADISLSLAAAARLQACVPAVAQHVTFHFVYVEQLEHYLPTLPAGSFRMRWPYTMDCQLLTSAEQLQAPPQQAAVAGIEGHNYALRSPYPNNLLRNIARQGTTTPWMMVLDVDIVPSVGTSQAVAAAIQRRAQMGREFDLEKVALVLPAFEVADSIGQLPADRTALQALLRTGRAQVRCREWQ